MKTEQLNELIGMLGGVGPQSPEDDADKAAALVSAYMDEEERAGRLAPTIGKGWT